MSREAGPDPSRAALDSAVKQDDSPFTTYLVSPWSKHVAGFAARREWRPDAVTVASLVVGLGAAGAFAAGSRTGLVAGAILLQTAFVLDCVDGQLARLTGSSSRFGGWLDSLADRLKEYLVYAGLAVGASRGFDDDVWILAAAALTLQTARHVSDIAYVTARSTGETSGPIGVPAGAPWWLRRGNQLLRLPIGERLALVSVTAAVASPRTTFVALLVWGGLGAAFSLAVRVLLSSLPAARIPRLARK